MTETKVVSDADADRTGASLSPEDIQKQQKAEEDKANGVEPTAEEKAKAEADATAKADEEAKTKADADAKATEDARRASLSDEERKAEDDKAEADKKTPDEPLKPKPRSIYDDLKDKKKEGKEKDKTIEQLQSELDEKNKLITDLTEKAKTATTPDEKKEVEDEIKSLAEEIGASPEGIAKLADFLSKKLVKPDGVQISKDDLDAIQKFKDSQASAEAQAQFTSEWNEFEPSLKKEFPHVSGEELSNIKKEVDRLAHTSQYHDKEIDYIYFKEKLNLEKLISPKRASFEGGDNKPGSEHTAVVELSEKSSPLDVMKATSRQSSSSLDIRPGV